MLTASRHSGWINTSVKCILSQSPVNNCHLVASSFLHMLLKRLPPITPPPSPAVGFRSLPVSSVMQQYVQFLAGLRHIGVKGLKKTLASSPCLVGNTSLTVALAVSPLCHRCATKTPKMRVDSDVIAPIFTSLLHSQPSATPSTDIHNMTIRERWFFIWKQTLWL